MTSLVMATKPYDHQRDVLTQTWQKEWWGLFMEMGTGKSKIIIDTIVNLYLTGRVDTVLYIAKKGEYANFIVDQIPLHKPKYVRAYVHNYDGHYRVDQIQKIKHMLIHHPRLRIVAINIEAIRNQNGMGFQYAMKYLQSSHRNKCMLVVDESTTLKDWRSSQFKAVRNLRKLTKWCRIATGTVMPHSPTDIFNQAVILRGGKPVLGYGGITAFKTDFYEFEKIFLGKRVVNSPVRSKNLDRLRTKISQIGTVLLKKDCLDLPDKIYSKKIVELTKEQEETYQELVDYHLTQIQGDTVEAVNALSLMLKLHQVVCGQIRTEDGTYHYLDNNRVDRIIELIGDMPEQDKFVVWSHFRKVSEELNAAFIEQGYNTVWMKAGLSTDERNENIYKFRNDPSCQIFQGNPQSSGFGLTLVEARTALYISNSDNYEHRLQSEDRIHRIGQTEHCLYLDLYTPGTVEDSVLNRNKMKAIKRMEVMSVQDLRQMIELK